MWPHSPATLWTTCTWKDVHLCSIVEKAVNFTRSNSSIFRPGTPPDWDRCLAEMPSLRAGNLKVIAFELPERAFTALRHRERYFSKAARALLNEIRRAK